MSVIDIVLTIVLNGIPIIILIVPLFFIREKLLGKLYFRIIMGIILFYVLYWILPIIFQLGTAPKQLVAQAGEDAIGLAFIAVHFTSLISFFTSYPLVTLPFIFLITPFISIDS